jgi:hypothetical protein
MEHRNVEDRLDFIEDWIYEHEQVKRRHEVYMFCLLCITAMSFALSLL